MRRRWNISLFCWAAVLKIWGETLTESFPGALSTFYRDSLCLFQSFPHKAFVDLPPFSSSHVKNIIAMYVHISDNFDLCWIWNHVDWWPLGVTFTGFSPNVEWICLNRPWIGGITFHARLCKNMRNISTVGIFVQRQLTEVEFGWIGENHGQPRWKVFKPCILVAQTSNHRNYHWLLKIRPHNPKCDSRAKEVFLRGCPFNPSP